VTPGELRLVWFPFSRHEPQPYKKRPVLVLVAAGRGPDRAVLVAMVTSNPNRVQNPGPGDVLVTDWQRAGLRQPSVVRTRRLWTAEERDFEGTLLGNVESTVLDEVRQHVRSLLGV
jgi:mRNA-degrading endonuclease toxin of MazEF toxin-antitoxin module